MGAETRTLQQLPRSIGLALSGGGYRAAAFHLGALSYLDRVGLLPAVSMLSTVSGGTLTGARYALSLVHGSSFREFFRGFYRDLKEVDLVRRGLERLGAEAPAVPSGRNDLIVSMAQVYAETLFADRQRPYRFGEILDAEIPLREVVFNATEFRQGIAFRFQKSAEGRIGNYYSSIPKAEAAEIRIADIVAASSCFPGGFEPLAFPDDFHWPGGTIPSAVDRAIRKDGHEGPLALMDGGVYDNQGIESLLMADGRDERELDAFIISDADTGSEDYYPFPAWATGRFDLTVGGVNLLARLLQLVCVLTVAIVGIDAWKRFDAGTFGFADVFRHLIPLLLAGGTAGGLWWARRSIAAMFERIPNVGLAAWNDIKRLGLKQVAGMLGLRMSSLIAMACAIFMHRIRALGYRLVYEDGRYEGKRISNLIYHLRPGRKFFFEDGAVPAPSLQLGKVVETAATMPTTLWFDDDRQQPCLVAAGQATLCYNLMKFVARNGGESPKEYAPEIGDLWNRLMVDWRRLVEDPYALLAENLPGEALPRPASS